MSSGQAGFSLPADQLHGLYDALAGAYGIQPWWPADSAFEVMVGAVLTQNTAWANVEKAIARLKVAELLSLPAVLAADHATLAEAVRPSGYFNIKAKRLRSLCEFLSQQGGLQALALRDPGEQRQALLSVSGIGPETADDILLYALDQPVFVIDAYTRRLLQRWGLAHGSETYEQLRSAFECALTPDVYLFQQYHALIVTHAKQVCRKVPKCASCALNVRCATGRQARPRIAG